MTENMYINRLKISENFSTCEERVMLMDEQIFGTLNFSYNLEQ